MISAVLALILTIGQDTVGQDARGQNPAGQVAAGQVAGAPGPPWQDAGGLKLADGRYLAGARATVSFVPADSIKAAQVLSTLEGAIPLPGLPPGVPSGVLLVLAPDEAQFVRLTGGAAPDWGAGVALPAQSAIVRSGVCIGAGHGLE